MTRTIAVVTADWHIHPFQSPSRSRGLDRLADGLATLDESLRVARAHRAWWLGLGDLKHVRGVWDQRALAGILDAFRRYPDVPKFLLSGNGYHDGTGVRDAGGGLEPFAEVATVMTSPGFTEIHGIPCAVWPWAPTLDGVEALCAEARRRKVRVLLGHGTFVGSRTDAGVPLDGPLTFERFGLLGPPSIRVFDLVFFGDVHARQQLGDSRRTGKADVWYPGSPWAQNWGETTPERGGLLWQEEHGTFTVRPVNFTAAPRFIVWQMPEREAAALVAHLERDAPLPAPLRRRMHTEWRGQFVRLVVPVGVLAHLAPVAARLEALAEAMGLRHLDVVPAPVAPGAGSGGGVVGAGPAVPGTLRDTLAAYIDWAEARGIPVPEGWDRARLLALGLRFAETG